MKNQIKRLLLLSLVFGLQGGVYASQSRFDKKVQNIVAKCVGDVRAVFEENLYGAAAENYSLVDPARRRDVLERASEKMAGVDATAVHQAMRVYSDELKFLVERAFVELDEMQAAVFKGRKDLDKEFDTSRTREVRDFEKEQQDMVAKFDAEQRILGMKKEISDKLGARKGSLARDAGDVLAVVLAIEAKLASVVGVRRNEKMVAMTVVNELASGCLVAINSLTPEAWEILRTIVTRESIAPTFRAEFEGGMIQGNHALSIARELFGS